MSCRQKNGVRYWPIFVLAWDWVGVLSNCTMGMFLGEEFGPSFLRNLAIVNRTYSRYPPSLHAVSQCKKSWSSWFILDNRKWGKIMSKKRLWQIMGESGHCYFFGCSCGYSNCILDWDNSYLARFITCLPPEIPREICFYPIDPKALVGIVNKVYLKR